MRFRFRNFNEFWPFYLRSHTYPLTRGSHYLGIAATFGLVGVGIAFDSWTYPLLALPVGYAISLSGHLLMERNLPVTCFHPLWSVRSLFRMFFLALSGKLGTEILRWRAGVKKSRRSGSLISRFISNRS